MSLQALTCARVTGRSNRNTTWDNKTHETSTQCFQAHGRDAGGKCGKRNTQRWQPEDERSCGAPLIFRGVRDVEKTAMCNPERCL